MVEARIKIKTAVCKECNSPVEIIIPNDSIGNAYGEIWICPIHGKDIEEIIATYE